MSKRKEIPNVMSELQGLGPAPAEEPAATQPPAAGREGARRRSKNRTPKSRLVGRATYDIGAEMKGLIHNESVRLGVPASQLARFLLQHAWDFYVNETIPLPDLVLSDSPKFRHTIDFGD